MTSALRVALMGQPNCGKSSLFNALTGGRQHVANYPGVTVDRLSGMMHLAPGAALLVDLPGAYSLTCSSPEERVSRDDLFDGGHDVVVDVVDASNLKRSLGLTLQLIDMGLPLVIALNMGDVAVRRGRPVAAQRLSELLGGVPVVETLARNRDGVENLRNVLRGPGRTTDAALVSYGDLGPGIAAVRDALARVVGLSAAERSRWAALALLEDDAVMVDRIATKGGAAAIEVADAQAAAFEAAAGVAVSDHIFACRAAAAQRIAAAAAPATEAMPAADNLTERLDRVFLHRIWGPIVLAAVVYGIYDLSIVRGSLLSAETWPFFGWVQATLSDLLPAPGFLYDPWFRALGLWLIDSATALLSFVPIFLILFALIAVVEDSGYMARIAVILDRFLVRFGLHGQSVLPYILSGVFAGGCGVPGVAAAKGIPDARARMATILTVPFMTCLAKVPVFALFLGLYFPAQMSLMTFLTATLGTLVALLVAKVLSLTLLRHLDTAPFVMEMPTYNLPTLRGVAMRSLSRTGRYIRKVGGLVLTFSVIVFGLLHWPLPDAAVRADLERQGFAAVARFQADLAGSAWAGRFDDAAAVEIANLAGDAAEDDPAAAADAAIVATFAARPELAAAADSTPLRDALVRLADARQDLRGQAEGIALESSIFGRFGRFIEPLTQFAGFDWKLDIALVSAFSARENAVATLGALAPRQDAEARTLNQRMIEDGRTLGRDAITAVSVLLFFVFSPPCLSTAVMIRMQTGSLRWMAFAIAYPYVLGFLVCCAVFSIGRGFGLDAVSLMGGVYGLCLAACAAILVARRRRGATAEGVSR